MIPRPQILVLAVLAGTAPAFAKGPGYLAMIGPAPMRFAKRVDLVVAEPLPPPIPEKAPEQKEEPKGDGKKPESSATPIQTKIQEDSSPPPPQPPPPPMIPAQDQSGVSPYQVLQYLLKPASTNAVQPVVVLPPINFTPPAQVVPSPSSTATYQKGP